VNVNQSVAVPRAPNLNMGCSQFVPGLWNAL